jgi:hypothetical protein
MYLKTKKVRECYIIDKENLLKSGKSFENVKLKKKQQATSRLNLRHFRPQSSLTPADLPLEEKFHKM